MDIIKTLKEYEGTKTYKSKLGHYKNDKFWIYKDSRGFSTIGYGHLVKSKEDFSNGLNEAEADQLLNKDLAHAIIEAQSLDLDLPRDSNWNDFLVLMVFQLGLTKTLGFKKFLMALRKKNYATAIIEVRDSAWYRQTPNRVDSMINSVLKG